MTAVLKGHSEKSGTNVLLRSYPSRTQPAIESGCAIWQAGRATSATKLAFKEIQIGTSSFLDEGYGLLNSDKSPTYNPTPQALEEAVVNEWPGQQVGLLLSIGTGKRPGGTQNSQAEWWEGFAGGLGSFAEAKRKLIAKIEGCEKTHREMLSTHLPRRGIKPDNYLRLNVEVGVGEFGMNEWNRLADISNSTQAYLSTPAVKVMSVNGAREMARVEAMRRQQRDRIRTANENFNRNASYPPPPEPTAVELPGQTDLPPSRSRRGDEYTNQHFSYIQSPNAEDKFMVVASDEYPHNNNDTEDRRPYEKPYRGSNEYRREEAPPLPPKTPIQSFSAPGNRRQHSNPTGRTPAPLPYPDSDAPPPAVNMARKPEYVHR